MKAMQLLLVEDSASDIRLVKEALKETGVPVQMTIMRDGVEALEHLRKVGLGLVGRPDLILLDLNLPRKNGREVLAEVKTSPNLKQIPVLVMTSSQSDEDVNQCYALNANCYITKPGDLDNYIDVVRAIEDFWFFTARLPEPPGLFPEGAGLGSLKQNSFAAAMH
jgi:two-component system, chemotaxis family, response regulator Rcp1